MFRARFALALALALGAALAPAARAAPVIAVDGQRAVSRNDPLVPAPSASDPGAAPRARTASAGALAARPSRGRRAVARALRQALRSGGIPRSSYRRYLRDYRRARSVRHRLHGSRGGQLAYPIVALERMALSGRLIASRMPVVFLTLERNTQYWPHLPFPAARGDVTFRGSELLFRYFPGEGLQLHPLATFKKANQMNAACVGSGPGPCRRAGLARLLDEMARLAVQRSPRFIAWEYEFAFGGGSPPWMSGMAQATGIQALARAAKVLGRPDYLELARRALGAFQVGPPVGVRTIGFQGGVAYLQYSFAPRYYIFNAFTQSLIGLYDFATLTGDTQARALFLDAQPELAREIPYSDIGDWSLYARGGEASDPSYHELLREVLQSMCNRRLGDVYCAYARRYALYQTAPPELELVGPDTATAKTKTPVTFDLSKLSAVEITIANEDGEVAFHKIASFHLGRRSFAWRPRSAGTYSIRVGAKELRTGRGLKGRTSGTIEVQ